MNLSRATFLLLAVLSTPWLEPVAQAQPRGADAPATSNARKSRLDLAEEQVARARASGNPRALEQALAMRDGLLAALQQYDGPIAEARKPGSPSANTLVPLLAARAAAFEAVRGRDAPESLRAAQELAAARQPTQARPAPPVGQPSPVVQVLREQLASAIAEGRTEEIEGLRFMLQQMERKNQPTGTPAPVFDPRSALPMLRSQLAAARRDGDRALEQQLLAYISIAEGSRPGSVSASGFMPPSPPRWVLAQAQQGLQHSAAGRFAEAEKALREACPQMRSEAVVIDVPMRTQPVWLTERVTAALCYRELAAARSGTLRGNEAGIDATVFEAAQQATVTAAGSAITRSALRTWARSQGAGPMLDRIDAQVQAMLPAGEQFVLKWGPAMSAGITEAQMPALMQDLARTELATRAARQEADTQLAALKARLPAYFELQSPQPLGLQRLQARSGADANLLAAHEALVMWMVLPGQRKGLVLAVSKDRSAWATMTLSGDEIATRVRRLRGQLDPCAFDSRRAECETAEPAYDVQAAHELYLSLLGQPAIREVVGAAGIKNLLVVPSGPLTAFPPSLLVTAPHPAADSGPEAWRFRVKWLLKEKAVTVLPSASSLQELRLGAPRVAPAASAEPLFMFADPDFSGTGDTTAVDCQRTRSSPSAPSATARYFSGSTADRRAVAGLRRLPCTRLEGEALLKLLGGTLLTGADARESQLRSATYREQLARADIVAFATHGLVGGDMGLGEPALALAAPTAGERGDDGVLTASEVAQMRFNADWVLLSACNTASPDVRDAEGLSGLSHAFFFAGARALMVSHWRVSDAASAQLVSDAVRRRRAGESKAEALRNASLAMLQGRLGGGLAGMSSRSSHPSYWGAFTVMGEPN